MYLYISEDGDLKQCSREPTADDLNGVEEGILNIVIFDGAFYSLDENGLPKEIEEV